MRGITVNLAVIDEKCGITTAGMHGA